MSKEFRDYLNNMTTNFIILKQNKSNTVFTMKEGFVKFVVDIKKLSCTFCKEVKECSLKKCKHIYFIYSNVYNVDYHDLQFLWVNDNYKRIIKSEEIKLEDEDTCCMVCLEDASNKNINFDKIKHCLDCGKFYHLKCLKNIKKENNEIKCLMCTNNWKPEWMKIK